MAEPTIANNEAKSVTEHRRKDTISTAVRARGILFNGF